MNSDPQQHEAAMGFRVKTGRSTAVLLVGPVEAPRVVDRRVIVQCDSAVPESREPYHAVMEMPEKDAARLEEQLRKVIEDVTNRSLTQLLNEYRNSGHMVRGIGLAVGSDIDPTKIKNAHIRAHALEGRLFRQVLETGAAAAGIPSLVIVERHAFANAAAVLGRTSDELKHVVTELGRSVGRPWGAEEKVASLAAWVAFARDRIPTTPSVWPTGEYG